MQPHDLDAVSLWFGLAFAGVGVSFLVRPLGVFDLPWQWVAPALILALGVVVLVSAVRGLNRSRTTDTTATTGTEEADELEEA
jgi:membrane protein implicated in regulation of membrane protease activity